MNAIVDLKNAANSDGAYVSIPKNEAVILIAHIESLQRDLKMTRGALEVIRRKDQTRGYPTAQEWMAIMAMVKEAIGAQKVWL